MNKPLKPSERAEGLARAQEVEQWMVRTGRIPARQFHEDGTPVWGQPVRCCTDNDLRAFLDERGQ